MQKENKGIEGYVTDFKHKSRSCLFGARRDSLIRDRLQWSKATGMSTERLWLNFGESHEHLQSSRIGKIVNIGFKQRGYQGHRAGGHCSAGQGDAHSQSDKLTPVNIRKGKKTQTIPWKGHSKQTWDVWNQTCVQTRPSIWTEVQCVSQVQPFC